CALPISATTHAARSTATAAHHAVHATHHVLHAAGGFHLLHHLGHHLLLLEQAIQLRDVEAGAQGDTALARALDQLGITALLGGHGVDQRLHVLHMLHRGRILHRLHHAAHARQLVEQRGHATHVAHLLELVLQILEVHGLAFLE